MKLNYDRKSKDPTYFIQVGIRNGKKVTTKNVERIGKHSELLKITDDPLEYAKQRVKEYNENIKNSKVEYNIISLLILMTKSSIKEILFLNPLVRILAISI